MITVVVPVYNAAEKLSRCIESVLSQTYQDFELILIDDGSSDDSFSVCNKFAEKDKRIRAYTQKNHGVSVTRNRGIQLARGKYVQFIDSDDSIAPEMLEQMLDAMESRQADMVICGSTEVSTSGSRLIVPEIEKTVELSQLPREYPGIFRTPLINSPCNKLYKKEKITGTFPENLSMGEDLLFNLDCVRSCSRIVFLQKPFYLYEKQETGLSSRKRKDTVEIAEILYKACMQFAKELGFGTQTETDISTTFVQFFCYGLATVYGEANLSKKEKKEITRKWAKNENLKAALKAARMPQLKQRAAQFLMKHNMVTMMHMLMCLKG